MENSPSPVTPVSSTTNPKPRVLVVEDDPEVAGVLQLHLRDSLGTVDVASNGVTGLGRALTFHYDAIVMDLSLPDLDGLAICQTLRQRGVMTPILMLTARAEEVDHLLGLEVGADDYMTKPFSLRELNARLKAMVRRAGTYATATAPVRALDFDDLHIDLDRRQVSRAGSAIELTAKEFALLLFFAQHPGHVFTRDRLLTGVWGYHYEGYAHTVNSHINRLRAKLESTPGKPEFILTVWGVGYRFRDA